jgi:preprotein translocase subunit YajC
MKFGPMDILVFVSMIAVIYFMIFLPKKKEQAAVDKMLSALKKGDKVVTNSGMFGEVAAVKDKIVTLKFHDGVRIDFASTAISRTVDEKEEAKA